MNSVNKKYQKKLARVFAFVMLLAFVLSACAPSATPAPTQDVAKIQTESAQTVVADMTQNAPAATRVPPTPVPPTAQPPSGPTPDPNIPVAVVPTAVAGEPAAVANYNTAIMSGPGTNYVVFASFLGGATAQVVGKSENGLWWAINLPVAPLGNGWVDSAWVTVSNAENVAVLPTPPVPPTTELVPPGPDDPQATALANTYVRTGPATNYPAYGVAPAGTTGRVIGKSEDGLWWVVRLNPQNVGTGYGWISAEYTQASNVSNVPTIQNPDTAASIPPTPPASGAPSATAVEYVNIRTGPGTNYPVLGVAAPGQTAEVTGKSADSGWWQIKIPTQYDPSGLAWVSASYVTTQDTGSVPVVEAPPAPPPVESTPPPTTATTGCALVSQSPADGTVITADTPFTTTWVLQNTGTDKWDAGEFDARYVGAASGVQMHTGADVYDLAATVEPGNTYNFSVDMIAPYSTGAYGEAWEVVQSNKIVCQFYVYITVP